MWSNYQLKIRNVRKKKKTIAVAITAAAIQHIILLIRFHTFSQHSGLTFPPTHTHLHGSVGVRLPHVCERVCACVFEMCQTEQEVMCSSNRL